jgi:hypothetical protein
MAEFSRKEASGAVILLIYMSGKLQGLRDNEIFYRSSACCPALAIRLKGSASAKRKQAETGITGYTVWLNR